MARPRAAQAADSRTGKKLLMEAAARLAARQGASSLVLREIAREAGLNHNTFYRHFADIESMMEAVVEGFASELRRGLSAARGTLRPGDAPTPVVVGWLFDFALAHRDIFLVAMRERYGPAGPVRASVRGLVDQLIDDMQRDLMMIGYLPELDQVRLRRVLSVSINEVFRYTIEFIEAPQRREELLGAARDLLEILIAGLVVRSR